MADFVFNIAKGKIGYYAGLPATNDEFIIVPLETTDIETDAVLKDYDDLATLLASTNNEQTTMGRKTAANLTVTVDDANDRLVVDMDDVTWTSASGNPVSKILVCYDADTTSGTDTDIIPLTAHDFVVSPNGGDVTAQVAATGFFRAV